MFSLYVIIFGKAMPKKMLESLARVSWCFSRSCIMEEFWGTTKKLEKKITIFSLLMLISKLMIWKEEIMTSLWCYCSDQAEGDWRIQWLSVSYKYWYFFFLFEIFLLEIDFCLPNPCKNDAQCFGYLGGFQCECTTGFSGKLCERKM